MTHDATAVANEIRKEIEREIEIGIACKYLERVRVKLYALVSSLLWFLVVVNTNKSHCRQTENGSNGITWCDRMSMPINEMLEIVKSVQCVISAFLTLFRRNTLTMWIRWANSDWVAVHVWLIGQHFLLAHVSAPISYPRWIGRSLKKVSIEAKWNERIKFFGEIVRNRRVGNRKTNQWASLV